MSRRRRQCRSGGRRPSSSLVVGLGQHRRPVVGPELPAVRGAPEHIGGDDELADQRAELAAVLRRGPPLRMFSVQVTRAVSPVDGDLTSVRKNWMYSVFAMISAYERSTSPRPVSTGQPGWTQETRRGPRRRQPGQPSDAARRSRRAPAPRRRRCWPARPAVDVGGDLRLVVVALAHAAPSTARATRTASAVARTSCTRTAQAPCAGRRGRRPRRWPRRARGRAAGRRRSPASTRPRNRLREAATSSGRPRARSSSRWASEREVVGGVLGEAEARVDDDPFGGDAARDHGAPRARAAPSTTSATTSSYDRAAVHALAEAAPVHDDERRAGRGDDRDHRRVGEPAAHVVDEGRAGGDGLLGDARRAWCPRRP